MRASMRHPKEGETEEDPRLLNDSPSWWTSSELKKNPTAFQQMSAPWSANNSKSVTGTDDGPEAIRHLV